MKKKVTFLRLVAHPGGPDGGTFPCHEHFERIEDGVLYTFGLPECPTDVFTDVENFNECPTKAKALSRLKKEKEDKERDLAVINDLIADLEKDCDYSACHLDCDDDSEE